MASDLPGWIASCLLLGLRIAPAFTFAPPFTLVRAPLLVRVVLGLGLAAALASALPESSRVHDASLAVLVPAAARELLLGGLFVLVLQLVFAALAVAGRTIDIQAGFGIALLIDPTTRTQTPLIGTLFGYVAGATFFAVDGHLALLRLVAATLRVVPLGGWTMADPGGRLAEFISASFLMAFGFAGAAVLTLLLIDLAITLLSRTVPQMNVLVLGFQVKTLALLLVLPTVFGLGGALLARMIAAAFDAMAAMA